MSGQIRALGKGQVTTRGDGKQRRERWGLGHKSLGTDEGGQVGVVGPAGPGSGSRCGAKARRPRSMDRSGPRRGAMLQEGSQEGSLCGVGLGGERGGSGDQHPCCHNPS